MATKESLDVRSFYYSACLVCMKTDNIIKCTKCKIAPYCGLDHQTSDFPYHKDFCKAVIELQDMFNASPQFMNDDSNRIRLLKCLSDKLGRRLKCFEHTAIWRQECCIVCSETSNLTLCPLCKCESFCQVHYKSDYIKHKEYCQELKQRFDFDKLILYSNDLPKVLIKRVIAQDCTLQEAYKCLVFERPLKYPETFIPYNILNPTLTVIYAFEKLGLIDENRFFLQDSLIIHIIGLTNIRTDFLCHWLTNLRSVKYMYFEATDLQKEPDLCKVCQFTHRTVEINHHNHPYNQVNYVTPPHLIIVEPEGPAIFNNKASYTTVFKKKVPVCILTDYEATMDEELRRFNQLGSVKYYLKNEINPFHEKLCMRSFLRPDGKTYFFHNKRISLFTPI